MLLEFVIIQCEILFGFLVTNVMFEIEKTNRDKFSFTKT
jgi:hypothetical protein